MIMLLLLILQTLLCDVLIVCLDLLISDHIEMFATDFLQIAQKPLIIMTHEQSVTVCPQALMIEQRHNIFLVFEGVSFNHLQTNCNFTQVSPAEGVVSFFRSGF